MVEFLRKETVRGYVFCVLEHPSAEPLTVHLIDRPSQRWVNNPSSRHLSQRPLSSCLQAAWGDRCGGELPPFTFSWSLSSLLAQCLSELWAVNSKQNVPSTSSSFIVRSLLRSLGVSQFSSLELCNLAWILNPKLRRNYYWSHVKCFLWYFYPSVVYIAQKIKNSFIGQQIRGWTK